MKAPEVYLNEIGCDCFYKALSYSLAYNHELENMLSFTGYDFLYNADTFKAYDFFMSPKDYLCKHNALYFEYSPNSELRNDYLSYIHQRFMNSLEVYERVIEISSYDISKPESIIRWIIENIKEKATISVFVNQAFLKDVYKAQGGRYPFMACEHYINIVDYNNQEDAFLVLDNYFMVHVWVPKKTIIEAINGLKDLEKEPNLFIIERAKVDCSLRKDLIISVLKEYLEESVIVNGKQYFKNSKAIKEFYFDWPEQVQFAHKRYGIYAAQFLSYPYIDFRHQINSLFLLLNKIFSKNNNFTNLREIIGEYNNQWKLFDLKLDKVAVQRRDIILYIDDFKKRISAMIKIDDVLQKEVRRLLKKI